MGQTDPTGMDGVGWCEYACKSRVGEGGFWQVLVYRGKDGKRWTGLDVSD